ncbi:hypothetical protein M758_UG142900 [Ceratodon purpureus]|nr:hypothetical protein M758_UG142900 [Ceratodon purpureus]
MPQRPMRHISTTLSLLTCNLAFMRPLYQFYNNTSMKKSHFKVISYKGLCLTQHNKLDNHLHIHKVKILSFCLRP